MRESAVMPDEDMMQRLSSLEGRVASIEACLAAVERSQKVLLTEIRWLTTKIDRLVVVADPARRRA